MGSNIGMYQYMLCFTLIMRFRFRASDFGQVAKTNLVVANRNRLLARNLIRIVVLNSRRYSCDSAVSMVGAWTKKKSSQRPLLTAAVSGAAQRPAECTSLAPELNHSSLR